MTSQPGKGTSISFLDDAVNDLVRLHAARPHAARGVVSVLLRLERGEVSPQRLRSFTKTGDLSDCGKLTVIVEGEPELRVVVRDLGKDKFEIVEVVTIAERADDIAYLVSALRLGRISDPVRRSDTERRLTRILAARRGNGGQLPT